MWTMTFFYANMQASHYFIELSTHISVINNRLADLFPLIINWKINKKEFWAVLISD